MSVQWNMWLLFEQKLLFNVACVLSARRVRGACTDGHENHHGAHFVAPGFSTNSKAYFLPADGEHSKRPSSTCYF